MNRVNADLEFLQIILLHFPMKSNNIHDQEQVCEKTPKQKCVDIELCPDSFETKCRNIPETMCNTVPMQVCKNVTQTIQVFQGNINSIIFNIYLFQVPVTKEVCEKSKSTTLNPRRRSTTTIKPLAKSKTRSSSKLEKSYLPPPPR